MQIIAYPFGEVVKIFAQILHKTLFHLYNRFNFWLRFGKTTEIFA